MGVAAEHKCNARDGDAEVYVTCMMTSGAIQNGVPTNVLCLAIVCDNRALTPKSASFTWPSAVTMMLAHCDGRGEGAGRGWDGVAP